MPANKKRTELPQLPEQKNAAPGLYDAAIERVDEHFESLSGILDGSDDKDARVYVYRVHPAIEQARGMPAYIRRYDGPTDIETIRQDVGGGVFRILVTTGAGQMARKVTLAIDGPPAAPKPNPAPVERVQRERVPSFADELQKFAVMARALRELTPAPASVGSEALSLARELMNLQRDATREESPLDGVLAMLPQLLQQQRAQPTTNPAPNDGATQRMRDLIEKIVRAIKQGDEPDWWAGYIERDSPELVTMLDQAGIEAARNYLHGLIDKRADIPDPAGARVWIDQVLDALTLDSDAIDASQ